MERQNVDRVVFRRITQNDWNYLYKEARAGQSGGYQSYIDFPTSAVTPGNWKDFFNGINPNDTNSGPEYAFQIISLGYSYARTENRIGKRRDSTFSLREQKFGNEHRVVAWTNAETGFPMPQRFDNSGFPEEQEFKDLNPDDNLTVYIARLATGEYYASWFQEKQPRPDWFVNSELQRMFDENAGYLQLKNVFFEIKPFGDPGNPFDWPFRGS